MSKILVVDDEEKIRDVYLRLLVQAGFIVRSAANAQQAMGILVREPVDLVLLDLKMPRIYGRAMFDVIESNHQDTKVIISSVYPIVKQKELVSNADDYYDKSEGPLSLLAKVSHVLGTAAEGGGK